MSLRCYSWPVRVETIAANDHPKLPIDRWIAFEKTLAPKECGSQGKSGWLLQSWRILDHIGETQVQIRCPSPVRFACLVFVSFNHMSASSSRYGSCLRHDGL